MTGGWVECLGAVNALIDDLVSPTPEMARVIGAVAKGDLSQSMVLETDGDAWRASSGAPPRSSTHGGPASARSPRR